MRIIVPPIKCQGIKTKLVRDIANLIGKPIKGQWIEPFCGSCVVALNIRPERAFLADSNIHLINFYHQIQSGEIDESIAREFLEGCAKELKANGEEFYYHIRKRFNQTQNPLDFLFLNRSCFNGVIRFNRKGGFNVPFCHKPDRFAPAYVTKICNQIKAASEIITTHDWRFIAQDFKVTLQLAKHGDVVYADPPYAGRHVDYFNSWTTENEEQLFHEISALNCKFILSTWAENKYRKNSILEKWRSKGLNVVLREHFYHVGGTEDNRHAMAEALVSNFASEVRPLDPISATQLSFTI